MTSEDPSNPVYVIRGKSMIAEVSVTAHANLVSLFTRNGLAIKTEEGGRPDMVRVRVSGKAEEVDDSVDAFQNQNPDAQLRIVESTITDNSGGGSQQAD